MTELAAVPSELLAAVALAATVLALVQTARPAWRAFVARRGLRLRWERAARGEARAADVLERLGYDVLGAQVAVTYPVTVDGVDVPIDLRADYLVALGSQRFVAEVKTGRAAPRIQTPATRRQLLEYRLAFGVDGVLLVDVEKASVMAVDFPLPEAVASAPRAVFGGAIAWLVTGAALGFLVARALR